MMEPTSSNQSVAVRPVTTDDLDFMVHLFLQLNFQANPSGDGVDIDAIERGTRASTREQAQGKIRDSITYVIEHAGEPAGRLRVVRTIEQIEIAGLQVLPAQQNHGIGTAVVTAILREGTAGKLPVVLQVEKDNPNARRLYQRLGFEQYDETGDSFCMRNRG